MFMCVSYTQGATDSGITPSTSSNSINAVAADDAATTPTPTPPTPNGPPVVILISHTAEPGSAASSALAAALQGGGQGPPTTQGASRRKGLRKVIEGLRRFGPIYLVEGDASTEEGLVYVLHTFCHSYLRVEVVHISVYLLSMHAFIAIRSKAGLERARACVMLADKTSTKLVRACVCWRPSSAVSPQHTGLTHHHNQVTDTQKSNPIQTLSKRWTAGTSWTTPRSAASSPSRSSSSTRTPLRPCAPTLYTWCVASCVVCGA